jgi:DNA adenine methylase Dam
MNEYIKSPINYTGNKFKLLGQIIPLFPSKINRFVDAFGGSGTVTLNTSARQYTYNEFAEYVYKMFSGLIHGDYDEIIEKINATIDEYSLDKTNENGYLKLRDDYNNGRNDWITLYVLCCYAFNSQGRFNGAGKFNMPFGKDRSCFSDVQKENIRRMKNGFDGKYVGCTNLSFDEIDYSALGSGDFVYFDPPYYGSTAVYNEKNGWTYAQEKKLAEIADMLDGKGISFAISNNLKYGNQILDELCERYTAIHLGSKYNNSSYHKKDKEASDDEVLVVNYDISRSNLRIKLF